MMEANDKVKDENINFEQSGNQVVHFRGNSDSELQALFDCVLKPSSQMPLQKPFKMRNLPKSFFVPPSHRQSPAPSFSHSREGSTDSTYGSSGTPGGGPLRGGGTISPTNSQAQHFRHHSSPASLQQTLSVAQIQHVHAKQHSFDALSDEMHMLPPNWEEARTSQGQVYYLNHLTKSTTWEDPRKKSQNLSPHPPAHSPQPSQPPPPPPSIQSSQPASAASAVSVPQPPPTASATPAALIFSSPVLSTAVASSTPLPSGPAPGINGSSSSATVALIHPNLASLPLPDGWEQAVSPEGEIYFINHADKNTSWFDPRIPRHLQTVSKGILNQVQNQQQIQQNQQLVHSLPPVAPTAAGSSIAARHQNLNFQRLHQEREKMRLRRQSSELAQRRTIRDEQQALAEGLRRTSIASQQPRQQTSQPQSQQPSQSLPPLVAVSSSASSRATGVELSFNCADPFMASTDFHSRQESADSGLGLGGNYTHPHTPEDFLNAMDDVDIVPSENLKQNTTSSPMMTGPPELESMDSEDLVPSITLPEDLSAEFLKDMLEPNKMENLPTWL